ncbi:hypothetical protein HDU88_007055 [Geranomyces variabilis]|nr:hypothetical protein HDU88_007055 [Geranomyces variabilis]
MLDDAAKCVSKVTGVEADAVREVLNKASRSVCIIESSYLDDDKARRDLGETESDSDSDRPEDSCQRWRALGFVFSPNGHILATAHGLPDEEALWNASFLFPEVRGSDGSPLFISSCSHACEIQDDGRTWMSQDDGRRAWIIPRPSAALIDAGWDALDVVVIYLPQLANYPNLGSISTITNEPVSDMGVYVMLHVDREFDPVESASPSIRATVFVGATEPVEKDGTFHALGIHTMRGESGGPILGFRREYTSGAVGMLLAENGKTAVAASVEDGLLKFQGTVANILLAEKDLRCAGDATLQKFRDNARELLAQAQAELGLRSQPQPLPISSALRKVKRYVNLYPVPRLTPAGRVTPFRCILDCAISFWDLNGLDGTAFNPIDIGCKERYINYVNTKGNTGLRKLCLGPFTHGKRRIGSNTRIDPQAALPGATRVNLQLQVGNYSYAGILLQPGREWGKRAIRRALSYSIRSSDLDADALVPVTVCRSTSCSGMVIKKDPKCNCPERSREFACLKHTTHNYGEPRCALAVCGDPLHLEQQQQVTAAVFRAPLCGHFLCAAHRDSHPNDCGFRTI